MSLDFDPRDPRETPVLSCDFADRLEEGETLTSGDWVVELAGVDVSQAVRMGACQISGTAVLQRVRGGAHGQRLLHCAIATTSAGRPLVHGAWEDIRKGGRL